jgi:aminoglycoside phosphotransferase
VTRPGRLAALIDASGRDAGRRGVAATEPEYRLDAERTIGHLAATLAALHAAPVEPAALRTEAEVVLEPSQLVARAESGTGEVGAAYRHLSRERLVEVLRDGARAVVVEPERLVLAQGRPTLANLRLEGPEPLGFADWTDAALADPYRDLALAARDVLQRFGPAPIQAFFGLYGLDRADPVRLDWYLLAAELGA